MLQIRKKKEEATEVEDDGSVESILEALKWKEMSDIWNHFERDVVDGRIKDKCNYCGKSTMPILGRMVQPPF
ncbi:putative transcription factor/ chromatin remodeling BED-type(Zn) family [Rosa chinensis]|uniref:Putative transcription factor/ chromatin remodeling BED-type(Zn) family n=1 Tax=Rosa chinensis TaxID=74649 RepID=A0A2P6PPU6_ROSCH|nr:putative transcription factor/ chromatin remodeling BED-type(Zn) family [Rosa chinensis]